MDEKMIKPLLIMSAIIMFLLFVLIAMGYSIYIRDNEAELAALKKQNMEISKKIDSLNVSMANKIDSIKVIKSQSTNTQTIYQRDIYHVWTTQDKDSVASIIRAQLDKLKSPVIN